MMSDIFKRRTVFIVLTILLVISLIPLFLTFFTAVIPEGDLFHLITGKKLLDFETKAIFLRTKMKAIGNKKYNLIEKNNQEIKDSYFNIVNKEAGELTGLAVFMGDKNFNLIDKIVLDIKTEDENMSLYLGIKDVDGNLKIEEIGHDLQTGVWAKHTIDLDLKNYSGIDLKHVSQFQILYGSESENIALSIDDIEVKYHFPTFMNFVNVWEENDFARYMLNSSIISIFVVIGNLFLSSMVAYALARKKFRGREVIFGIILATMMIPPQITIIPIFMMMEKINWINTYFALIVPVLVSPFGIFLMRQYIEQLPTELDQAAYVDGANDFQIFFRIILPLSGPGLAVLGINSFISSWNSLYYPLVLTNSKDMRTVQVGLALFSKLNQVDWPKLMAASTLAGLPVIVIFLIFQKQIISGLVDGAVKS